MIPSNLFKDVSISNKIIWIQFKIRGLLIVQAVPQKHVNNDTHLYRRDDRLSSCLYHTAGLSTLVLHRDKRDGRGGKGAVENTCNNNHSVKKKNKKKKQSAANSPANSRKNNQEAYIL